MNTSLLLGYLKLSLRQSRRYVGSSVLSIAGLTLAFTCSLLIYLYTDYENSFDRHHKQGDRIFRVAVVFKNQQGERIPDAFSPSALAPALVREVPEVEMAARLEPSTEKVLVRVGDRSHYERNYCAVDPDFFNMFTVQFLEGSPAEALTDANSIVVTKTIRDKYFPEQLAVGKALSVNGEWGEKLMTITGVIDDFPATSHFHFSMLGKLVAPPWMESGLDQLWDGYNWYTYVKLYDGVKMVGVQNRISALLKSNIASDPPECMIQPLHSIHLQSDIKSEIEANGNESFVVLLGFVGAFLLLAGLLNFVNLSLVRALFRSREAGIRKIIGSSAARLYVSFITDSMLYLFCASVLSSLLVYGLLPFFNTTFDTSLDFDRIDRTEVLLIAGVGVGLCLLTSSVPAAFFSRVQPVRVMKGALPDGDGSVLRNWLLGFQLATAIAFIAGIVIVNRQMHFLKNQNLGFNPEQLLVMSGFDGQQDPQATKNRFLEIPEVMSASFAGTLPGEPNPFFEASTRNNTQRVLMDYSLVDEDYLATLGIPVVAGRGFSKEFPEDARNFSLIVNETGARLLGLNENAPGQEITPDPKSSTPMYFKIVGVIKDHHVSSFHEPIKPFLISASSSGPNLVLRVNTMNHAALLKKLQSVWKSVQPDRPFDFRYLDQSFYSQYQSEENFQLLFEWLTVAVLAIACAGLFSVSNFILAKRKREVGIHKLLGASQLRIYALMNRRFLVLIFGAMVVAIPMALLAMTEWLSNFAYRIDVTVLDFAIAVAGILIATFAITGYQLTQIARLDVAETLRGE